MFFKLFPDLTNQRTNASFSISSFLMNFLFGGLSIEILRFEMRFLIRRFKKEYININNFHGLV